MKLRQFIRNDAGLTLIEIMAVIVLIALIMGVVGRGVIGQRDSATAQLNVVKMEKLKHAIEQYRFQYGRYPGQLDDMLRPSSEMQRSGELFTPLASEEDLKDVWKSPYLYKGENNGRSFSLSSYGSDGIAGGEGAKQDVTLKP